MNKFNSKNSTVVSALILLAIEMLSLYAIWINIPAGYGQVVLNSLGAHSPSLENNNGTSGAIKKLMERQLTVAASHNNTDDNNDTSTLTLKAHDLKNGSNKGPNRTGPFSLPFIS